MDYPFTRLFKYDWSDVLVPFTYLNKHLFMSGYQPTHITEKMSNSDKFFYIVLIIVIIKFITYLNIGVNFWITFVVSIIIVTVFILRQGFSLGQLTKNASQPSQQGQQGHPSQPLVKNQNTVLNTTSESDNDIIEWLNSVSHFKKYNLIEFNKMIRTINTFLTLKNSDNKINCRYNIELMRDVKTDALNKFHSIIHTIPTYLIKQYNGELKNMENILNVKYSYVLKECEKTKILPINIDSNYDFPMNGESVPNDISNDKNYNVYN